MKSDYLFEVYKDGKRVFWTDDISCVPEEEIIKCLKKAKYKVKERRIKDESSV